MTFALRSLRTGGVPSPVVGGITLTAASNGGFNPWTIPTAVYYSGKVFYSYVDGASGNMEVAQVNDASLAVTGPTTLKAALEADAHSSPALLVRPDGKLLAVYGRHNNSDIYRRISTNAGDSTAWGTELNLDSSLGGTRYTDWQLYQLLGVTNDPVMLFYRDEPSAGTDSRWVMASSTDNGSTFGAQSIIYQVASSRSYVIGWTDSDQRIHFAATNGTGTSPHVLGHFYYDNGSWFASDGTSLGSPPFDATDLTVIHSGTDSVFPYAIALEADGTPVLTYYTVASNVYAYHYARWDGSAWQSTTLATGLDGFVYELNGVDTAPLGLVPDDADPSIVYSMEATGGGSPALYRYATTDSGATFSKVLIAPSIGSNQSVPAPVRNRGIGLRVLWQFGSFTNYTSFSLGTKGSVR